MNTNILKHLLRMILIFFLSSSVCSAVYINEENNRKLLTRTHGQNVCLFEQRGAQIKVLTYNAVSKEGLTEAMMSTTYLNRVLIAIPSFTFAWYLENPYMAVPTSALITAPFDDLSHFIYGLLPLGYGEQAMRSQRLKNLLSGQEYTINDVRYKKIVRYIPILEKSTTVCMLKMVGPSI